MAVITADMIKTLRERTGVGMGKCKEALEQASGDMELAIDNLRKAGIASAVKKEARDTKEGTIVAKESAEGIAIVELNAETDFVVQNERFKEFAQMLASEILRLRPQSLEALLEAPSSQDPSLTLDQTRALVMQSLGENIRVRRFVYQPKEANSSVAIYSHMGGKILTMVEIVGASGLGATLGRDIAMHIAAEAPEYLSPEEVPAAIVAKEKEIATSLIQGNKPPQVVEKILEGKVKAYYEQACLVCQKYVRDNAVTIAGLVEQESKKLGKPLALRRFLRWQVGA